MKEAQDGCDANELEEDDDCAQVFTNCNAGGLRGRVTEDNFADRYLETYCAVDCTADLTDICSNLDRTDRETTVEPAGWTCEPATYGSDETFPTPPFECFQVCGY